MAQYAHEATEEKVEVTKKVGTGRQKVSIVVWLVRIGTGLVRRHN